MRKKFKPGQSIVFEPTWAMEKFKGGVTYKTDKGHEHPLKYGDIVLFLAYITPAYGHCIITTYEGKIETMLHLEDFRAATDDEV